MKSLTATTTTSALTFKFSPPLHLDVVRESSKFNSDSKIEFIFRSPLIATEEDCNFISCSGSITKSTKLLTQFRCEPTPRNEHCDDDLQPTKIEHQDLRNCNLKKDSLFAPNPQSKLIENVLRSKFPFIPITPGNRLNTTKSLPLSKINAGEKIQKGYWTCPTCYLNNNDEAVKCIICETLKSEEKSVVTSLLLKGLGAKCNLPEEQRKLPRTSFDKKCLSSNCSSNQTSTRRASPTSWTCDICLVLNRFSTERCIACDAIRADLIYGPGCKNHNQLLSSFKDGLCKGEKQEKLGIKKAPFSLLRSANLNYRADCDQRVESQNLSSNSSSTCTSGVLGLKQPKDISIVNDQNDDELRAKFENFWQSRRSIKSVPVKRKSSSLLDEPAAKIANIEDRNLNCAKPSSSETFCTFNTLLDVARWKMLFEEERLRNSEPKAKRLSVAEQFAKFWKKRKQPPEDAWECPKCRLNNRNDLTKCVCCSTLQPGVLATATSSTSPIPFDDACHSSSSTGCQTLKTESSSTSTQLSLSSNSAINSADLSRDEDWQQSSFAEDQNLTTGSSFMPIACNKTTTTENDCSKKIFSDWNTSAVMAPLYQNSPMFSLDTHTVNCQNQSNRGNSGATSPQFATLVHQNSAAFASGGHELSREVIQNGSSITFPMSYSGITTQINQTVPTFGFNSPAILQQNQNDTATSIQTATTSQNMISDPPFSFPTPQQNQDSAIDQSQICSSKNFDDPAQLLSCSMMQQNQFQQWLRNASAINKSASSYSFGAATTTRRVHFAEDGNSTPTFAVTSQSATKSCTAIVGGNKTNALNFSTGSSSSMNTDFSDSRFQLRRSMSSISMNSASSDMSVDSNKSPKEVVMDLDKPSVPFKSSCCKRKRKLVDVVETSKNNTTFTSTHGNKFHTAAKPATTSLGSVFTASMNSTKLSEMKNFFYMGSNNSSMSQSSSFSWDSSNFGTCTKTLKSSITTTSSSFCSPVADASSFQKPSTAFCDISTLSTSIKQSAIFDPTTSPSLLKFDEIFKRHAAMPFLPIPSVDENRDVKNSVVPFGEITSSTEAIPPFNPFNSPSCASSSKLNALTTVPGLNESTFPFSQQGSETQVNTSNQKFEEFQFNSGQNPPSSKIGENTLVSNPAFNPENLATNDNEAENPFLPTSSSSSSSSRVILRAIRRGEK